jgi:hypothetical protein
MTAAGQAAASTADAYYPVLAAGPRNRSIRESMLIDLDACHPCRMMLSR